MSDPDFGLLEPEWDQLLNNSITNWKHVPKGFLEVTAWYRHGDEKEERVYMGRIISVSEEAWTLEVEGEPMVFSRDIYIGRRSLE
jgi:hypothetical protein